MKIKAIMLSLLLVCGAAHIVSAQAARASMNKQEVREARVADYNNISNEFNNSSLTGNQIQAFEARGVQKVQDFTNFVEIIGDQEYDYELRERAVESASKLFEEDGEIVLLPADGEASAHEVKQYLASFLEGKALEPARKALDVKILEGLVWDAENSEYRGKISFSPEAAPDGRRVVVAFVARKVNKSFGNRSKLVWDVLLTRMEKPVE